LAKEFRNARMGMQSQKSPPSKISETADFVFKFPPVKSEATLKLNGRFTAASQLLDRRFIFFVSASGI